MINRNKIFKICDYLRVVLKRELYLFAFAVFGIISPFLFILKQNTNQHYLLLLFLLLFFLQSIPTWLLILILRKNSTDNIFRTLKTLPLNNFDLFKGIIVFVVLVVSVLIIVPLFILSFMDYNVILEICKKNNIGFFEYFYTYYLFALIFSFVLSMFVFIFFIIKSSWLNKISLIVFIILVFQDFDFLKLSELSEADIGNFLLSSSTIFAIKIINLFLFFALIVLFYLAYKIFDKKFIAK